MNIDGGQGLSLGIQGTEEMARLRAQAPRDMRRTAEGRPVDDAEVGRSFERVLSGLLVKQLRESLPEGFFGGGAGADTYSSWMDEHLANALADSGALRIADMVAESVGRLQQARSGAALPGVAESDERATGATLERGGSFVPAQRRAAAAEALDAVTEPPRAAEVRP